MKGQKRVARKVSKVLKRAKSQPQDPAIYRGVVEDQTELICRFRADGTIVFVNEVFCRFFGRSDLDVVGMKWHPMAVGEDLPRIEAGLGALSPANPVVSMENRVHGGDGRVHWMQFVSRGIFDANGGLLYIQAVGRDITERRKIEDDLRQITERFELAVAGTSDGLWDWDLTTGAVFYSSRFKELLGFAHDDVRFPHVYESFRTRLHPEDLRATEEAIQRAVVEGQPYRAVYRLQTVDGTWRWFEARGATLRGANGRATRMAGSISDITERKQADNDVRRLNESLEQRVQERTSELETAYEALRENEARFRAIFEQAGVAVGLVETATGRFVRVNQRYCDIMGMTSGQLLDTTLMAITHPDDLAADLQQMEEIKQGVIRSFSMEKRLLRPDGSPVWVNLTVSGMRSLGEALNHHIAVIEDITRRKQAEEEVRQLNKTLEQRVHDRTAQLETINVALQQSQARLAEAQSIAGVGSFEFNVLTGEVFWSDETYRLWGRDRKLGPVGGEEAFTAIHPEDRERARASFDRSITLGVLLDEQVRLIWADGSVHHFHLKAKAQHEGQRVVRLVGTIQDVTWRKRTEAALRNSDQSLVTIFKSVSDSIWMVSVEDGECYRFRSINDAFVRVTGFTREQVLHRRIEEWFPPGSLELVKSKYREAVTTGRPLQYEETTELPAGLRVGEITIIPIVDSTGRCDTLLGTARDVTERKKAQAVLRESEEKFRALFELAPIGIAILDMGGHYLNTNRAYQQMLGYEEDELKRFGVDRLTHPDDVAPGRRLFAELLEGTRESYQRETRYLSREGQTVWAESSASAIRDHLGQLRFIVSMVEDITGRKRSEKQNQAFSLLGHRLGAADTPKQAASIILEIASELFGWDAGFVDTYSHDDDRVTWLIILDTIDGQRRTVPTDTMTTRPTPMLRHVLEQGARLVNRRDELPVAAKLRAFGDMRRRSASLMYAPIRARGASIGLLSIQSYTPSAYSDEDLRLLQALADHCGDALRRITFGHELRTVDAQYRSIVDNAREGIFQITPDGNHLLSANPALARMLGYDTREELMTTGGGDFRRIHTCPSWWHGFSGLMKRDGSVQDAEVILHRKDGGTVWANISAHAVQGASGVVGYLEGTALDIDQRKQAENQLRLQRDISVFLSGTNELKSAAERLVACVLLNKGIDCAALYLVDEAAVALHLIAQQGLPTRWFRRATPLPLRSSSGGIRTRGSSSRMTGLKKELRRRGFPDPETLAIREAGRVVAVLCFCNHVGELIPAASHEAVESIAAQAAGAIARIRSEQALRASRQLMEEMLGSLRAAVFVLDSEGNKILECNPAAVLMFGHQRGEMIGRSVAMLHLAGDMYGQFRERLRLLARKNDVSPDFEVAMRRKNKSLFPSEHSLRPLRNEAGHVVNWVNIVRDITARKLTEQELRSVSHRIIEAQEGERQRVARELHDGVNQTIASAMMRLRKVADGDSAIGPLNRERLARSVDLLSSALEENRRIARNLRPSDLDNLGFAAACRNFCRQFQSRSGLVVKLRLGRMPPRLAPLLELNLFRIMQEALTNVEKHAHAQSVWLRIGRQKKSLILTIQDDGRGFSARRLKEQGGGIGLGLASIQERTGSLGGICEFKSVPGHGTVIRICVPLVT